MAENAKSNFNGNLASSNDNPLDTANVLQKGINGLSLIDFMKLTGMVNKGSEESGLGGVADGLSSGTAKSGAAKTEYGPKDSGGYAPVIDPKISIA